MIDASVETIFCDEDINITYNLMLKSYYYIQSIMLLWLWNDTIISVSSVSCVIYKNNCMLVFVLFFYKKCMLKGEDSKK